MDINQISSNNVGYVPNMSSEENNQALSQTKKNSGTPVGQGNPGSVAAYNQKGQPEGVDANKNNSAALLSHQIRKQIWDQAYVLLKAYSEKSQTESNFEAGLDQIQMLSSDPQDPIGLHAYFQENPEDWQQVQMGIIPDYFNIENTGDRILDIWLGDSKGTGSSVEFLNNVKDMINQAYGEVTGMLGELPQLVLDTQAYIEKQLDELIAAASESENQSGTDLIDTMA